MDRKTALIATSLCALAAIGCENGPTARQNADAAIEMQLEVDAELSSPDAGPPPVSFGRVLEIFAPTCLPCHSSTPEHPNASAKLDLGTRSAAHAQLVNVAAQGGPCKASGKLLVVPGDPAASLLMQKLDNTPELCGNPMPKPEAMQAFAPLDAAEMEEIAAWISAGALDD